MTASQQSPDPRITWPARYKPSTAQVFTQNTIDIAASPDEIWSLLVDCTGWPVWYRHCSDVSVLRGGPRLSAGGKFRFKTIGFFFEPEIVTFEPSRHLVWAAGGPAGTGGAHAWFIDPIPGGCRVITEEAQSGLLLRVLGPRTRRNLLSAHEDWLRALKELAEAKHQAVPKRSSPLLR